MLELAKQMAGLGTSLVYALSSLDAAGRFDVL